MCFFAKILRVMLAIFAFSAAPSFAIIGIGGHGSLDLTTKIDAVDPAQDLAVPAVDAYLDQLSSAIQPIAALTGFNVKQTLRNNNIYPPNFERTEAAGLMGGGAKFYIDALPIIDLEAALNIVGKDYNFTARYLNPVKLQQTIDGIIASTITTRDSLASALLSSRDSLDKMFVYGRMHIDLTIRKTIIKFPPMIKLLRFYLGIGPSFYWATPLITPELFNEAFNDIDITNMADPTAFSNALIDKLTKKIQKELKMGGHLMFGVTIKPPIMPFAIYADGKFNFGHEVTKGAPGTSFLMVGGLALAF